MIPSRRSTGSDLEDYQINEDNLTSKENTRKTISAVNAIAEIDWSRYEDTMGSTPITVTDPEIQYETFGKYIR
jgi:hypothetical protein